MREKLRKNRAASYASVTLELTFDTIALEREDTD